MPPARKSSKTAKEQATEPAASATATAEPPPKLYINRVGGSILELVDGSREHYLYGREVDLSELSENQRATIHLHADTTPKSHAPEAEQVTQTANEHPAFETVPADFNDLDEDAATGVVRSFEGDTIRQTSIIAYEMLHKGRERVLAQAPDDVRIRAVALRDQVQAQAQSGLPLNSQPAPSPGYAPPIEPGQPMASSTAQNPITPAEGGVPDPTSY